MPGQLAEIIPFPSLADEAATPWVIDHYCCGCGVEWSSDDRGSPTHPCPECSTEVESFGSETIDARTGATLAGGP